MGTAQAGGVIALAAAKRGIDVHFHTPSEVKAAVTGNGGAGKAQVTAMVTKILALQQKPTPADAADALALAICHCWRAPMIARMAQPRRWPPSNAAPDYPKHDQANVRKPFVYQSGQILAEVSKRRHRGNKRRQRLDWV